MHELEPDPCLGAFELVIADLFPYGAVQPFLRLVGDCRTLTVRRVLKEVQVDGL